jgi:hypothetical protein
VIGASPAVIRFLVLFEAGAVLFAGASITVGVLVALWWMTPWFLSHAV